MEFEVKFEVDEAAAKALRAGELNGVATQSVRSVYFDTATRDLRDAGLALRVREVGGRHLRTLKGLIGVERFEREEALEGAEPDLSRLSDSLAAEVLAGERVSPVFETRVQRSARVLVEGNASIELALDEGEIVAGARREPIGELELELKAGKPASLFRMAERLRADHRLRLEFSSKAARGYRLLDGQPCKERPVALSPSTPWPDGFRALAQADLASFAASIRRVQAGDSIEAVHQARVALRRLRALVRPFREMVEDGRRPEVEQTLRQWAERFGQARDLDVFVSETFRPLARHEPGAAAFGRRLLSAQAATREAVRRALMEDEVEAFLLSTLEWVMAGDWVEAADARGEADRPLSDIAPTLLDQAWRGFRKRGDGLDWTNAPARHRLRIQAKKLRYLGDALEGAVSRPHGFDKDLRRFQAFAGRLNDLHLAADVSRGALGDSAPPDAIFAAGEIVGAARAEEPRLIRKARKAYEGLLSRKPYWR